MAFFDDINKGREIHRRRNEYTQRRSQMRRQQPNRMTVGLGTIVEQGSSIMNTVASVHGRAQVLMQPYVSVVRTDINTLLSGISSKFPQPKKVVRYDPLYEAWKRGRGPLQ